MDQVGLVAYSHGDYMSLGEKLGSFGYSVRKKPAKAMKSTKTVKLTGKSAKTRKFTKDGKPVQTKNRKVKRENELK